MFGLLLLLSQMKRSQRMRRDALEKTAERKLLSLIRHARATVPYYKKTLGQTEIRSFEGYHSVPILSKADMRGNARALVSSLFDIRSLVPAHTSGSTGIQVPLFHSRGESAYGVAFETHHLTECGAGPFDLQARIAHYESQPNLLQRLGVFRCRYLDVRADETENLLRLAIIRPDILVSYPSVLHPLSRINSNEDAGLRMKFILSGGETLSPHIRREISSSFSCPVYDRYGSMESSWAAWECREGSLHVQEDMVHVEIVDSEGKGVPEGTEGAILVTPLWRRAMPILRYSLGDRGSFGPPCRCGRSLRTLRISRGREDDIIVLPSGKVRSARTINLMDDIEGILSYQIIQEEKGLFVFRYVPSGSFGTKERREVAERIRDGCLGEAVEVVFQEVQSIPRGATGKIRAVVSKVKSGSASGAQAGAGIKGS